MNLFVLTSPRATEDPFAYLKRTVEQIDLEQIDCRKHIVVDADQLVFEDLAGSEWLDLERWTLHRYERPPGSFKGGNKLPYWHLLELARLERDEALCLEDDLEFCTNAVTRMLTLPVPVDVAWLQFFSAWTFRDEKRAGGEDKPGWQPHPGLWRPPSLLQGCQAIKYPLRTLEKLCSWKNSDEEWQKFNESDVSLGLAQERLGLRGANHVPDLVQHEGDVSVVSHGMFDEAGIERPDERRFADATLAGRRSATYPGKGFDAMRLYARHHFFR